MNDSEYDIEPPEWGAEMVYDTDALVARPIHFAHIHLNTALLCARHAADIQRVEEPRVANGPLELFQYLEVRQAWDNHRSYVVSSVMSSAAFLEASVNEIFWKATEDHAHYERFKRRGGVSFYKGFTEEVASKLAATWERPGIRQQTSILDKFELVVADAGNRKLNKGVSPYQDVKLVLELRNELVHFKPYTANVVPAPGVKIPVHPLETRLKKKFPLNPLLWTFINGRIWQESSKGVPPMKPLGSTFFPDQCLGVGCAIWTIRSCVEFVSQVNAMIGIGRADQFSTVLERLQNL